MARTLVSKLVANELGNMKKAEDKEEVKGKELRTRVMAILEEVKKTPMGMFQFLPCLQFQLITGRSNYVSLGRCYHFGHSQNGSLRKFC